MKPLVYYAIDEEGYLFISATLRLSVAEIQGI